LRTSRVCAHQQRSQQHRPCPSPYRLCPSHRTPACGRSGEESGILTHPARSCLRVRMGQNHPTGKNSQLRSLLVQK
jgi:hypothetical protein